MRTKSDDRSHSLHMIMSCQKRKEVILQDGFFFFFDLYTIRIMRS